MSQNSDTLLYIPRFLAVGLYLVYIIVSRLLYCYTSPNYAGFADLFLTGWILPLFWIILLVSVLSRPELYMAQKNFLALVILIIIFQIASLLFNSDNCFISGSQREFNFIQKVFIERQYKEPICLLTDKELQVSPWVNVGFVYLIRIIFYILNLVLIISLITTNY